MGERAEQPEGRLGLPQRRDVGTHKLAQHTAGRAAEPGMVGRGARTEPTGEEGLQLSSQRRRKRRESGGERVGQERLPGGVGDGGEVLVAEQGEADFWGVHAEKADAEVAVQQGGHGVGVVDLLVDGALLGAVQAELGVAGGEPGLELLDGTGHVIPPATVAASCRCVDLAAFCHTARQETIPRIGSTPLFQRSDAARSLTGDSALVVACHDTRRRSVT
jgi:hypothetical protein